MTVQIDAGEYKRFSQQLRQAERGVKNSIRKRVREAGKPLSEAIIREGAEPMPSRVVARFQAAGNGKLSQTGTGIRFVLGRKGSYPAGPDRQGRLRHPLYGNREHWYSTPVPSGTWSRAFEAHQDEAVEAVSRVLQDVMEELK